MEQQESFDRQSNSFESLALSNTDRTSLIQGFESFDFKNATTNTSKEVLPNVSFYDSASEQKVESRVDDTGTKDQIVDDRSRKEPSEKIDNKPEERTPGEQLDDPTAPGRAAPIQKIEELDKPSKAPKSDEQTPEIKGDPAPEPKTNGTQLPTGDAEGAPSPNETFIQRLIRSLPSPF